MVGLVLLVLVACQPADERAEPPSDQVFVQADEAGQGQDVIAGEDDVGPCDVESPAGELTPDSLVKSRISPGECHVYSLMLQRDDFIEIEVEQQGVDVVLRLLDPEHKPVLVADLPIGEFGPEQLLAVAAHEGRYWMEVEAWPSETSEGSYIAASRSSQTTAANRLRAQAARSFAAAEQRVGSVELEALLESYDDALELWQEAEDEFWQALTVSRKGRVFSRSGQWRRAAALHDQAAERFRALDRHQFEAFSLNDLGTAFYQLGELEQALKQHARALELRRRLQHHREMAISLQSLAAIYKIQGETQKALDHFSDALTLTVRPAYRRVRAYTLHNLGSLYRQSGKYEEAKDHLVQAEQILADLGRRRQQANALNQLGQLAFELEDYGEAVRQLRRALEIYRQIDDRRGQRGQAVALHRIGSVLRAKGETENARRHYRQALDLLGDMESPRTRASVLARLGFLHDELGQVEEALGYHYDAVTLFEKVGDQWGQSESLLGAAISERRGGDLEAARRTSEQALNIAEILRVKPLSEDLRFSFFSTAQRFFEFHIDLLMDLQRGDPAGDHAAIALEVSERARARSLLDLLSEAGADIRADAAPELLEEEQALQKRINASIALVERSGSRQMTLDGVRRDLGRLYEVRAAILQRSPRYAALTQFQPLNLRQIQRQVLDRETLLLEYKLGRERSFLWLVGTDTFSSFELASGEDIESSARQALDVLRQGGRRESEVRTRVLLCELSRKLLRPVAGQLGHKRLAIVADGALQYLPFAALPDPDAAGDCLEAPPLIVAHEITYLPSASTLSVLRSERRRQPKPAGLVAVVADPVFGSEDERVERQGRSGTTGTGRGTQQDPGGFRRLHHSRAEAESILRMVPADLGYQALDFDASKETVRSGVLADYRVVHFATHGILDANRPELSGVVLSQVDRQGRPVDGFLRAHEIYSLRLPAELVVLGACETALGKEVKGEGLVGLTRGFMYAGASRVMVSLWRVSDRGTAELMLSFYQALLRRHETPSAALRTAQLAILEIKPHPFYWAGFVLQGEWRPGSVE